MTATRTSAARAADRRRGGFTLIELLAVLMILSILGYFLFTSLGKAKETVEEKLTRTQLGQLGAALGEYSDEHGDFPPSTFATGAGPPPNATNLGAESLYIGLCAEGQVGEGVFDVDPCNTDEDRSPVNLPGHATRSLLEISDRWGNPVAYQHNRDYGREDVYVTYDGDTGELIESTFRARRNEKTERWHEPRRFQLVSAGLDGQFGTEDDIEGFGKP